jgi:hypothetical protein
MQLMQKNLPLSCANRNAACKCIKNLFLTIGNAVNVQSPDIGKPDIYTVIFGHPDKNLLPTYLHFSGLPIVRNSIVSVYPIDFNAFACGIPICIENR